MSRIHNVMYHYVRPIAGGSFNRLNGLELEEFDRQLDYLQDRYRGLSVEEFIYWGKRKKAPSAESFFLTFDDGYAEHLSYVLPRLKERGLGGAFFPVCSSARTGKPLDVNLIHFMVAQHGEYKIYNEIESIFMSNRSWRKQFDSLKRKYFVPGKYDNETQNFVKRVLQSGIKLKGNFLIEIVVNQVGSIQGLDSLYMNEAGIKRLVNEGMLVGGHGDTHIRLGHVEAAEQESEVKISTDFLFDLGVDTHSLSFCYPYGSLNDQTLAILRKYSYKFGFSTEGRPWSPVVDDRLLIPRWNTNDWPKSTQ